MYLNNFQGEQLWKIISKIVKNVCDFTQNNYPSGCYGKYFSTQTDWFHSYQWNETIFKVGKSGKANEKSLQTFHTFCEQSCVAMPAFQSDIHSIQLRTEIFFNIDWLILFIPMQWNHFESWQIRKKLWKIGRLTGTWKPAVSRHFSCPWDGSCPSSLVHFSCQSLVARYSSMDCQMTFDKIHQVLSENA